MKETWKNIQQYKKVEANKSQSSLSKSFEASASNKVLHQETFTIPSYQVKNAYYFNIYNTKNKRKICESDKTVGSCQ